MLSSLFGVTLCAYVVMSNHYHLVVKLNPEESERWSDDEVLSRWTALFKGPLLVQRYRTGEALLEGELDTVRAIAAVYRARLGSLSWIMKCLNEPIARRANAEDRCTGHIWEARFHSQALVSEQALLAVMAYVDLNPIRARMAKTPEESEYTSLRARLSGYSVELRAVIVRLIGDGELHHFDAPVRPLMPFSNTGRGDTLPIRERDYLELVEASGRVVRPGKRGSIDPNLEPVLERLDLSIDQWTQASTAFRKNYRAGKLNLKRSA